MNRYFIVFYIAITEEKRANYHRAHFTTGNSLYINEESVIETLKKHNKFIEVSIQNIIELKEADFMEWERRGTPVIAEPQKGTIIDATFEEMPAQQMPQMAFGAEANFFEKQKKFLEEKAQRLRETTLKNVADGISKPPEEPAEK